MILNRLLSIMVLVIVLQFRRRVTDTVVVMQAKETLAITGRWELTSYILHSRR